jgi:hypothetical protein
MERVQMDLKDSLGLVMLLPVVVYGEVVRPLKVWRKRMVTSMGSERTRWDS